MGDEDWPWKISEESERWLREHSGAGVSTLLELGTGNGTGVLAESFPAARILSLEHHAGWFGKCLGRLGGLANVTLHHAPIDGTLPWYDCREIDFELVDLLFISGPEGPMAQAVRAGAPGLRSYLKEGARVVLDGMDAAEKRTVLSRWLGTGGLRVEMDEPGLTVLEMVVGGGEGRVEAQGLGGQLGTIPSFAEPTEGGPVGRPVPDSFSDGGGRPTLPWAEKVYVPSLPEREDRREELRKNWEPLGLEFKVIEGVRPEESDIRWEEMKGMEAYGKADNLLERCDCEWDLFMQRSHASLWAFCVVPMPAYQGKSHSDIVRSVVQPPNR